MPQRDRWFFCFLLGCFSVLFAEVTLGSYPTAFYNPWGWFAVYPIYTLHLLVLLPLAFRRGIPRLPALYAFGAVLGLYEAYITKQLWHHTWGDSLQLQFGGVSWFAVLALVFYWHPFMAFIVPTCCAELFLTRAPTGQTILSQGFLDWLEKPRRKAAVAVCLGLLLGLNQAGQAEVPYVALVGLPGCLGVAVLVMLWQSRPRTPRMSGLLPVGTAYWVLCALLLTIFAVLGAAIRREAMPGLGPQAVVWAMYLLFGVLAWRARRWSIPVAPATPPLDAPRVSGKYLAYLVLSCYGVSAVAQAGIAGWVRPFLFVWFLVVGVVAGLTAFVACVVSAVRTSAPAPP